MSHSSVTQRAAASHHSVLSSRQLPACYSSMAPMTFDNAKMLFNTIGETVKFSQVEGTSKEEWHFFRRVRQDVLNLLERMLAEQVYRPIHHAALWALICFNFRRLGEKVAIGKIATVRDLCSELGTAPEHPRKQAAQEATDTIWNQIHEPLKHLLDLRGIVLPILEAFERAFPGDSRALEKAFVEFWMRNGPFLLDHGFDSQVHVKALLNWSNQIITDSRRTKAFHAVDAISILGIHPEVLVNKLNKELSGSDQLIPARSAVARPIISQASLGSNPRFTHRQRGIYNVV